MDDNTHMVSEEPLFFNRELSWVEFNERVLEEAEKKQNPLWERFRYLSIVSSNLDEFFMVRVAALVDQLDAGFNKADGSGMTPAEQLPAISNKIHWMMEKQYQCYHKVLLPLLQKEGINILKQGEVDASGHPYIEKYYRKTMFPVLTPLLVDNSRPFPLILNKSLNIALLIADKKNKKEHRFGLVQVPSVLSRFIELSGDENERVYILQENIIKKYIHDLFAGHEIVTCGFFRITRNADLGIDEEGAEDLLETVEQSLKKRKWGSVIRLEVEKGIDSRLINFLKEELEVGDAAVYNIPGPLDLTFLMKMARLKEFSKYCYDEREAYLPSVFKGAKSIFDVISKGEVMLHHPYETFDPVVELVRQAADDPDVLAIKQTLYRVSGRSPIVEALMHAAENGKQVVVLVELKARFEEEKNIVWARRLEQSGCQVIYGLKGLKTHCKMLLIVRMEEDGIKRYVHVSTGNYNDETAKIYTDIGFFTCDPQFGADASSLFNVISGYSELREMNRLAVAPFNLRQRFVSLIKNEKRIAESGRTAFIIAKLNSLVDDEIIQELYAASQSGVNIQLIVRGICCLRPGVQGLSDNITVRSLVGRYLEHSRIYMFNNDGRSLYYLASADWMPRNLDRRLEISFPIENSKLKDELWEILQNNLRDVDNARILHSDGSYEHVSAKGKQKFNCQEYFYSNAVKRARPVKDNTPKTRFIPVFSSQQGEDENI